VFSVWGFLITPLSDDYSRLPLLTISVAIIPILHEFKLIPVHFKMLYLFCVLVLFQFFSINTSSSTVAINKCCPKGYYGDMYNFQCSKRVSAFKTLDWFPFDELWLRGDNSSMIKMSEEQQKNFRKEFFNKKSVKVPKTGNHSFCFGNFPAVAFLDGISPSFRVILENNAITVSPKGKDNIYY